MEAYRECLVSKALPYESHVRWAVEMMAEKDEPSNTNWRAYALCQVLDPELFDDTSKNTPNIELAKRACASCVVTKQCLDYALSSGQTNLVFGGKTSRERKAELRKQRRAQR